MKPGCLHRCCMCQFLFKTQKETEDGGSRGVIWWLAFLSVLNFSGVFQAHWERAELRRIAALFSKRCLSHYAPRHLRMRTQIIVNSFLSFKARGKC